METTLKETAEFLRANDNYVILTHQNPDGDTLGSAFALYDALTSLGKNVRVINEKQLPPKYGILLDGYREKEFEEKTVIAVDIASVTLLGNGLEKYADRVDLCIDHHISNSFYAKRTLLGRDVTAACEVVYDLILELCGKISNRALICVYTGISTDCGCFKYSNTTAKAHRIAALAIERKIDIYRINQIMFESKSRSQLEIERIALQNLSFYYDGKCSLMLITRELLEKTGATESDLDVLPSMARQIQGVEVGVVIKERNDGEFKISLRTGKRPDASAICSQFGGGGHVGAAGCTIHGTAEKAKADILEAIGRFL